MYLIVIGDTRMVGGITKIEAYEADDFASVVTAACEFREELVHTYIIVTEYKEALIEIFDFVEDQIAKGYSANEVIESLSRMYKDNTSFVVFALERSEGSPSGFLRIYKVFGDYAYVFNRISKELESELKNREKIEELLNNEAIAYYFGKPGTIRARILLETTAIEPNCAMEVAEIAIEDFSGYSYIRIPILKCNLDKFQKITTIEQLLRFLKNAIVSKEEKIVEELESMAEYL